MKIIFILFATMLFFIGCSKNVSTGDVLRNLKLSQKEVLADGQSTIAISVELTDKSSSDRRNIIFTTSNGIFSASGTNKFTAKAEFEFGILMAKSTVRVSTSPGVVKIIAQPEFDSQVMEYTLTDSAVAKPSEPFSIKLEPSSLGIASNFLTEVELTGHLKNTADKFVSKGYQVSFQDLLLSGSPAGGRFRNISNTTSDSSKVSAVYGAVPHPIGTSIKIRATVLDGTGAPTVAKDSVILTINQ